jgi:hypothetical protein
MIKLQFRGYWLVPPKRRTCEGLCLKEQIFLTQVVRMARWKGSANGDAGYGAMRLDRVGGRENIMRLIKTSFIAITILATVIMFSATGEAFKACVNNRTGNMRLQTATRPECTRNETLTTFGEDIVRGEQGPLGPQGPQGLVGATGPQGLKGDVGATGAQGPKGEAGATGATGPAGLSGGTGFVGFRSFRGSIPAISDDATDYVFIPPTVEVVTLTDEKVIGWAAASLGRQGSGTASFKYGLCFRAAGSTDHPQPGFDPELAGTVLNGDRVSFPAFIDRSLGEGDWEIGYCVKNDGNKDLNNNRYVSGWVMVVESEADMPQ